MTTGIARQLTSTFLDTLAEGERRALTKAGVRRRYARGIALFHERQEADSVMVVLDGRVKISRVTTEGREAVLTFRGPGELLGEVAAIDGRPRSATAVALEPVEVLVVPASAFLAFLRAHPDVALRLLRMLTARLREASAKVVELGVYDTVGRVSAGLLQLAELYGEPVEGGVRIGLPITQEDLAGWCGASREAVTKALHTLRELGWVRTGRREITVLDADALRRRATF